MAYSVEEKIEWFAIISRIYVMGLQFVFNAFLPDYDASAFRKPFDFENKTQSVVDRLIKGAIGGFSHWDSQYFLHIAQYGYTYENTLAFFPFFPLIIRHISYFIYYSINYGIGFLTPYENLISAHNSLLVSSVVLNNLLFIRTAKIFFKLSMAVLKNEKFSYLSTLLFCINPASIFFSACYSESLFCFLSFFGMLQMENNNLFLSSIIIGLSGLTRSNGVINIGFILYAFLRLKISRKLPWYKILLFPICVIMSILPFACYQLYCYMKYCLPGNDGLPKFIRTYAIQNNYKLPGNDSPWCQYAIPFAYSYVQNHYWNVGFLQYYELKQIPNFLLALPVFIIISTGTYYYIALHKTSIFYLGLRKHSQESSFPISSYAYVVHCLALSIFAALYINVQVATRMLFSASPVPYWFSAWFVTASMRRTVDLFAKKFIKRNQDNYIESSSNKKSKWKTFLFTEELHGPALWIKHYYVGYFVVGTFMFSNSLPWT